MSDVLMESLDETRIVNDQFEKVLDIFKSKAFSDDDPVMCELHDVFGTYDTSHHNCLGCNFADSIEIIHSFLRTYEEQKTIQSAYSTLIILLYLLVERIDILLDIIALHQTYRDKHFKVLTEVRRWANFLKHPKAFLLTHHAIYTFLGHPDIKNLINDAEVKVDRSFIDKYYSNNDKNKDLYKTLENKENVLVVFPNALELVQDVCDAMNTCVEVIRDNPVYREVVEEKTTFYDYWTDS